MNPIYRFYLGFTGSSSLVAYPIYKGDLAKEFEKESGQQFFREKLSGKVIFEKLDYQRIESAPFDAQFLFTVFISYNGGQSWLQYWAGNFWKTDCEFDRDAQTVSVTPTVRDRYSDILAGLEKEFDLLPLAPKMARIKADKRPMIQVYAPGQTTVGCFLSGMWWEQECEAVGEYEYIRVEGQDINKLTDYMHFRRSIRKRFVEVSGNFTPQIPSVFFGDPYNLQPPIYESFHYDSGGYRFQYSYNPSLDESEWEIIRISDGVRLFYHSEVQYIGGIPENVTLDAVPGSGATGSVDLYIHDQSVYARLVCDKTSINGTPTFPLPADDMVANNRNYHYVIGYDASNDLYYTAELTSTPTQWGIYQPGQYYQPPYVVGVPVMYPVARNTWTRVSLWFSFSSYSVSIERAGRAAFTIRDAYPLDSVISVLLNQIAPDLMFSNSEEYSEFLYGSTSIGTPPMLYITPKSNIISSGYDQPAQTAPVTLKSIFDMLRDCFRCYWFVDSENHLRIEHIRYFMKGGSYTGVPLVGIDLTQQKVPRNGKAWAFGQNKYSFDKPNMASRYQFSWMDEVTQQFKGSPIDIVSRYVEPGKIEQIDVAKFTSDIDYILLNPGDISKDGFVLLGAEQAGATLALPYYTYTDGVASYTLQNGALAFCFLQNYYAYDMPARNYSIGGAPKVAAGIKKLKSQSVIFPVRTDPNVMQLVRTELGDGMIEKASVDLSSRSVKVTLKYDTE